MELIWKLGCSPLLITLRNWYSSGSFHIHSLFTHSTPDSTNSVRMKLIQSAVITITYDIFRGVRGYFFLQLDGQMKTCHLLRANWSNLPQCLKLQTINCRHVKTSFFTGRAVVVSVINLLTVHHDQKNWRMKARPINQPISAYHRSIIMVLFAVKKETADKNYIINC